MASADEKDRYKDGSIGDLFFSGVTRGPIPRSTASDGPGTTFSPADFDRSSRAARGLDDKCR